MKKRSFTFILSILFLFLSLNAFKYLSSDENNFSSDIFQKNRFGKVNSEVRKVNEYNKEEDNRYMRVYSFSCPVWTANKRVTWNSGLSQYPRASINTSDHIHLVWHDSTPGNQEIYFRKSTDGGATWSALDRLTWTSGGSWYPDVAIDSNSYIHLTYNDSTSGNNEVYYRYSTNGGTTWSSPIRVTWNSGDSWYPQIAIDSSDTVHLVWFDDTPGNPEIYYRKSTNFGTTWSVTKRLSWTSGNSYNPSFCIDSANRLHVVYEDNTGGNYEIYFKRSTDGGTTWTKKRLTWTNPGVSRTSNITADSSNDLYLVYQDTVSGNTEIYFKKSTDGGINWSANKRLTWNSGDSLNPVIDVKKEASNTFVNVVWRDNSPGNNEIFYKYSIDGGLNWTLKRLTWNSGSSEKPLVVFSSGKIHVIWQDLTPGNYEIYHRGAN